MSNDTALSLSSPATPLAGRRGPGEDKVLASFCQVAVHFEKDLKRQGYHEIAHLLSVARAAAEDRMNA